MKSSEQTQEKYGNHATVWQLLPWYVNGSLSVNEQQLVAVHATVCLVCHKELGLQRALRESVQSSELDDVVMTASFDRLSAQLAAAAPSVPSGAVGLATKLVAGIGPWLRQLPVAAYAAAAALVLAVGVGYSTINVSQQPINNTFRTLSNSTTATATTANLRIIFAEDLSTSERAIILNQSRLTAVSGPDARGMYYVKSTSQTLEATEAALTLLRANKKIVFAESVLASTPATP